MLEQQLLNALTLGSVYALFALGFTLVFGVLAVIALFAILVQRAFAIGKQAVTLERTYAALVAAALWPLLAWRGRGCLLMYAALVGWSRMAAGMHFPGDVLAGWGLGLGCTVLSRWLISFATAARAKGLLAPALPWYGVAAAAVAADQAAKLSIERAFVYGKQVEITPFFNLVHVLNPGAAFSFLAGASGWQRYFFTSLAAGVSVVFIFWLMRMPKKMIVLPMAIALILGGAIGNLIDRVSLGYVVDFIHVYYQNSHFPAFNLADSAITLGTILLLIDTFFLEKKRIQNADA